MRKCEDCIVCCVYLRIDTTNFKKEAMRHCIHVVAAESEIPGKKVCYNGGGCSIYKSRPEVCQGYHCLWLEGYGEDNDRPDKCGVLIDRVKNIENAIECKPIWEFAADERRGYEAIRRMSKAIQMPACVTSFYERKLIRVEGRAVE